jgi:hypothetical protein
MNAGSKTTGEKGVMRGSLISLIIINCGCYLDHNVVLLKKLIRQGKSKMKYYERLLEMGCFTRDEVCALTENYNTAGTLLKSYIK